MVQAYQKELTTEVSGYAMDSMSSVLDDLFRRFSRRFEDISRVLAEVFVNSVNKHSESSVKSSLEEIAEGMSFSVPAMAPAVVRTLEDAILENVDLIKSIPKQFHGQIIDAVEASIKPDGKGAADIMKIAEKYHGVTSRRAKLIAEDQTRKINSQMNAARVQAAGVTKFEWIHSSAGKEPREDHVAHNGKVYEYSNPPNGEMPGELINCRCVARPIVEF